VAYRFIENYLSIISFDSLGVKAWTKCWGNS